ncbi:response regulator [Gemmatimonadota bacterium]
MEENEERKTTRIDDWMVRVSFAEAGEVDTGFMETGIDPERKSRLALDKIMIVRDEIDLNTPGDDMEETTRPEGPAKEDGEKLRVMILDDEPIVGKRLSPALEKQGFEVEVFLDPRLALDRLNAVAFDIIVTDVRMEEIDGIQVLEHVMTSCPDTRVILITGYATVEVAREALVKGAFDFIAKPFKPKDLRAVISKAALSLGHRGII